MANPESDDQTWAAIAVTVVDCTEAAINVVKTHHGSAFQPPGDCPACAALVQHFRRLTELLGEECPPA